MEAGEGPPGKPAVTARLRRPRLAHKFIALSGSLVLLTSTSIALFVVRRARDEGRQTLLRHGLQTAELLAQNAEYAVYTEDPGALEALTSVTSIDGDVVYVVITNAAGRSLAQKGRGGLVPPPARTELYGERILHEERVGLRRWTAVHRHRRSRAERRCLPGTGAGRGRARSPGSLPRRPGAQRPGVHGGGRRTHHPRHPARSGRRLRRWREGRWPPSSDCSRRRTPSGRAASTCRSRKRARPRSPIWREPSRPC